MQTTLPLFAIRTSLVSILVVMVVCLILGGLGRVAMDAVHWYKDQMMDPYRDLRKTARADRKPKRTLEELVNEDRAARSKKPNTRGI